MSPRSYDAPARARRAEETRRDILRAAAELFVTQGWAATSVGQVAARAGVTAQTVYNAVGTKRELLKAAYDVTLVGDDAPVPLAQRPEVVRMYALTEPAELLHAYADLGAGVLARVGPLLLQVAAGALAGDPDLAALQQTTDAERLTGTLMVAERVHELGGLSPDLTVEAARDRVWALNSVHLWHALTGSRGWRSAQYAQFVGDAMCAAVLRAGLSGQEARNLA